MKFLQIISFCCGILLLHACGRPPEPPAVTPHVDITSMHPINVPYVFDYPGIVQGVTDYPVVSRISGAIFKQFYTEGTYVQKNTILYQIDERPYRFALATYQGNLVRDSSALDNYKSIYQRYKKLYPIKAVALQDVETAEINYKTALGNVQTDIANINNAKLNLEYCLVRAPADGYISQRQVTVGNMVNAFTTVLNQINSVNDMYIQFAMPENDRLDIEQGVLDKSISIPLHYKFNVSIELADGTMLSQMGYLEFYDTRISLQNGVWNLRAYINNTTLKHKLLAGQFVHVYLHGAEFVHTYAVPQVAVFRDDNGPFVYILNKNIINKRYITTGKMVQDLWIITQGINDGDQIVVNGGLKVNDHDKVIVDHTLNTTSVPNA